MYSTWCWPQRSMFRANWEKWTTGRGTPTPGRMSLMLLGRQKKFSGYISFLFMLLSTVDTNTSFWLVSTVVNIFKGDTKNTFYAHLIKRKFKPVSPSPEQTTLWFCVNIAGCMSVYLEWFKWCFLTIKAVVLLAVIHKIARWGQHNFYLLTTGWKKRKRFSLWMSYSCVSFCSLNRQQKMVEREKRSMEQQRKKMEKEAQRMIKKEQKIAVKLS